MDQQKIDEILKILIHPARREIIKRLAMEGPQTYSELMKKLGFNDSGTFGFHLRTLKELVQKNQEGKYELTELGWRIYNSIISLEQPILEKTETKEEKDFSIEEKESPAHEHPIKERSFVTISDRLSLDIDKNLLENIKKKGQKLYVRDVVTVTIHNVSPELLDEVLEAISDVVTINVPKELKTIVELKSQDVFMIKSYDTEPPRSTGFIDGILSQMGALIAGITTSVLSQTLEGVLKRRDVNIYPPINITATVDPGYKLYIDGASASIDLKLTKHNIIKGEAKASPQDVVVTTKDNTANISLKKGSLRLNAPETIKELYITNASGKVEIHGASETLEVLDANIFSGATKIDLHGLKQNNIKIHTISGGISGELAYTYFEGESIIDLTAESGVISLNIVIPEEAAVDIDVIPMSGGISFVEYEGQRVTRYRDPNYDNAKEKIILKGRVQSGGLKVKIEKQ